MMTNLLSFCSVRRFIKSTDGNFAIMTAFALPVLVAFVGVAVDMSRMLNTRSQLQAAADTAALIAAKSMADNGMTEDEAKAFALKFVKSQLSLDNDLGGTLNEDDIEIVPVAKKNADGTGTYTVTVNAAFDVGMTTMTGLLGIKSRPVAVNSVAQTSTESTKSPLSMYLVLDRSGSMADNTDEVSGQYEQSYDCSGWVKYKGKYYYESKTCYKTVTTYVTKIKALKNATESLFSQLSSVDPDKMYVRTGAISYNSSAQTPVALDWGTSSTWTYVNALTATGGTDSTDAFKTAYQSVSSTSEDGAHKNKNGGTPKKYIVFMTDGENNYSSADTDTKNWCDAARTAGIEVYSVAFMAPTAGQALLSYCATDSSHYFDADNASELTAAFNSIGAQATAKVTRLTQ